MTPRSTRGRSLATETYRCPIAIQEDAARDAHRILSSATSDHTTRTGHIDGKDGPEFLKQRERIHATSFFLGRKRRPPTTWMCLPISPWRPDKTGETQAGRVEVNQAPPMGRCDVRLYHHRGIRYRRARGTHPTERGPSAPGRLAERESESVRERKQPCFPGAHHTGPSTRCGGYTRGASAGRGRAELRGSSTDTDHAGELNCTTARIRGLGGNGQPGPHSHGRDNRRRRAALLPPAPAPAEAGGTAVGDRDTKHYVPTRRDARKERDGGGRDDLAAEAQALPQRVSHRKRGDRYMHSESGRGASPGHPRTMARIWG
ncbi:hypothetical protein C8R44DRAFT_740858 [Mycena epipterygia]|nr:hypothetical protein C8R44DRAFT_740858 [Mycena epipterygia]